MEIVYLLVALGSVALVGLAIYLIIALSTKRIEKDAKRLLIRKTICNQDKDCSCCNGNCDKFIDGVINNEISIEDCPKISSEDKLELKELLDIKSEVDDTMVAHVFCKGGARAVNQYGYVGPVSCDYSNRLYDGLKVCQFGCQGCMDCAKACPTGAIRKNNAGVAEVDRSLCIGCGECVKKCPDNLIKLIDIKQEVVLSCKQAENQSTGAEVGEFCSVGCIKCGECTRVCPTGALYEENGLIKFDRAKCINCAKCVNACPNTSIAHIRTDFLNF